MKALWKNPLGPLKRALDLFLCAVVLGTAWPIFLLTAILIKLEDGGPIFFVQERVGLNGQLFGIFKYRTMVEDAEPPGGCSTLKSDDDRITKVGRFIRRWSIDELPQIFNIALGQMSVVGPRPTLAYQVEQYTPQQRRRLLVKPGVTGWAQVNGRNSIPWDRRIELDVEYVERYTFWLDILILSRTFGALMDESGVYGYGWPPGSASKKDADTKS